MRIRNERLQRDHAAETSVIRGRPLASGAASITTAATW
jgi:hypothetical protein